MLPDPHVYYSKFNMSYREQEKLLAEAIQYKCDYLEASFRFLKQDSKVKLEWRVKTRKSKDKICWRFHGSQAVARRDSEMEAGAWQRIMGDLDYYLSCTLSLRRMKLLIFLISAWWKLIGQIIIELLYYWLFIDIPGTHCIIWLGHGCSDVFR